MPLITRPRPVLPLLAALACAPACATYKLAPPDGFVEVSAYKREVRMKAQDNVGLKLSVFSNVRGGTLGYWSVDLVNKLAPRGYRLIDQAPVTSANGVVGARFDFDYTAPGDDQPKFFIVVVFPTDEHLFVLDLAGDKAHAPRYSARVDEIAGDIKVRGCKLVSKICRGPQPPRLSTPGPDAPTPTAAPVAAPAPAAATAS
ncbi:MAG: hypothetical protein IPK80_18575 [Nannocystis sp.]|nr:hypothetical protein [Nannocystis sp.]